MVMPLTFWSHLRIKSVCVFVPFVPRKSPLYGHGIKSMHFVVAKQEYHGN